MPNRKIPWLPASHVFEGMRTLMIERIFRWDLLATAMALNGFYLVVTTLIFLAVFEIARRKGLLLNVGE